MLSALISNCIKGCIIVLMYDFLIPLALFTVGFLYASVGHGGASGYIAVLSIFSVPVAIYKSIILIINIVVAGMGFIQFSRAGFFKWHLCWPFLITSIPFAILGSKIHMEAGYYNLLLGLALLVPVIRLLSFGFAEKEEIIKVELLPALLFGVVIGFLSGLLNIGGGIFLSPVLILMAWGNAKEAAAVSSLFIVLNSLSGLLGNAPHINIDNHSLYLWVLAAVAGGGAGAYFGSHRFGMLTVRYLLSLVLMIASVKLIFFM